MKYSMLERSANGNKDIGAFYGVNRTNKINDYQMSDMKNMDSESFPYLATRRERKLFYDAQEMATICHDTDITDNYAVTGVTKAGGFAYRGEKLIESGLSPRSSVTEFLGDYVLLPEKKYVRVVTAVEGASAVVESFSAPLNKFEWIFGDESGYGEPPDSYASRQVFSISRSGMSFRYSMATREMLYDFLSYFFKFKPGMFFRMELYGRKGFSDDYSYTYCNIPEDVYMVIDDLYIMKNGKTYHYGDEGFNSSNVTDLSSGNSVFGYIDYTVRREKTGVLYDISQEFMHYTTEGLWESVDTFTPGFAKRESGGNNHYTNGFVILPEAPVMLFGEYYNGRLFACDNMGVDIYYSPGGSVEDRYNFEMGESLGGAGAISCAESGKWTALKSYGGALYAFKKNGMYRIYSNDGLSFYMDKVCDVGAVSQKAVCVVSDVMYFLSETGLYRFTGTYPEELSDNLGRHYTDGVLGGYDNKVYCSLVYSSGCELVVYDAAVRAYGVHDDFKASDFVTYGGKLYGLDSADGYVYEMSGERVPTEFALITRKFFLSFEKKAINGIRLYFDFSGGENEKMEVFVSYDGGEWEPCFKPIVSGRLKYVPIKFKKCDELAVKIAGYGVFTLKGMTLSLYSGGDIRQNR